MLELVQIDVMHKQVENPLDRSGRQPCVLARPCHYPDKGRLLAGHEGRHTENGVVCDSRFVRPAELLERPPARDLLEDPTGIDALALQHRGQGRLIAQVATLVVPKGEQRQVRAEELIGKAVADDDPDLSGEQVRLSLRIFPDRRAAVLDVGLVE